MGFVVVGCVCFVEDFLYVVFDGMIVVIYVVSYVECIVCLLF